MKLLWIEDKKNVFDLTVHNMPTGYTVQSLFFERQESQRPVYPAETVRVLFLSLASYADEEVGHALACEYRIECCPDLASTIGEKRYILCEQMQNLIYLPFFN